MVLPLLLSVLTPASGIDTEEWVCAETIAQLYRTPEVTLPGNHLADLCGQHAPVLPMILTMTVIETLQLIHEKAVSDPHDIERIRIMEQTAKGLYRLWQMPAGIRIILVVDGFTTLPGQGLFYATVAQVFAQVVSTGLLPLWLI